MGIDNLNGDDQVITESIHPVNNTSEKQNSDQYLDTLDKITAKKLQENTLSDQEKEILNKYNYQLKEVIQNLNDQKSQNKANSRNIRKIELQYSNDDNFLSGKGGSGNGYGNDNGLTGGVEVGTQWQTNNGNIHEIKTNSEVYTNNQAEQRGEYHELKIGNIRQNGNSQLAYGVVGATTHGDIGNKVQSAIHRQLGYIDRSEYDYDRDRGSGFGVYIEQTRINQILGNNHNGIQGYFGVGGQVMSEYGRTKLHGTLGIKGTKHLPAGLHLKGDISGSAQYNFQDPRGQVIENSFDGKDAIWIDSEIAIGAKILGGDLDFYAIKSYLNKNRDPDKQEKNAYSVGVKWMKGF